MATIGGGLSYNLGDTLTKLRSAPQLNPEGVALVFEGERLTYSELDDRARGLATGLSQAGFEAGDTVAVLSHNRTEWFPLFFAVARLGGVFTPINFLLTAAEIEYILDDAGARWVFCEDRFWGLMESDRDAGSRTYVGLGDAGERRYTDFLAAEAEDLGSEVDGSSLFTLLYTSGTTGLPKGAMHTQATVLWNSFMQIADFELCADDTHYVVPSLCWGAGFHDLTLPVLWVGGKVVLKQSMGFDPGQFCETVESEQVTKTLLVPSALRQVTDFPELGSYDMSSLRTILCGGESVPVDLLEVAHERLPGAQISQVYGLSEFPSLMTILPGEEAIRRVGSTGLSSYAAAVRVVDSAGEDVSAGEEVGEIVCRSPAVMTGYLGKPEATEQALRDGWLHTGDLARVQADGYLQIVGRAKDMYISGGLNVYPAEVERVIARCSGVREVAVVGIADDRFGESGHAIIVCEEAAELGEEGILSEISGDLARYKLPRSFDFRSEPLPRTASGKVQKRTLIPDQGA
jgi:fatty-acyl-CoA synthase